MPRSVAEIIEEIKQKPRRLELPGNPRYQPASLVPYFGYDNIVRFQIEVEWALWKVLAKVGILPVEAVAFLTEDLKERLYNEITTTLQDAVEKEITRHDIRALIRIIHQIVDSILAKWTHFPATSYDIIDTARIIAYKRAFLEVSLPSILQLVSLLRSKVIEFVDTFQIGRTHGQHAEPITVGFWLATVLSRILDVTENLIEKETKLVGKFSGPVGAYNAQVVFGLENLAQIKFGRTFEELVLEELGLVPGPISTQILSLEPLARFLFEYTLLSGALSQLALDCRNLQRTEIAEIGEPFEADQSGSSAMPHKRNPITWENTQGMGIIVKNEFGKVLDCLLSEHQRDLTTSSVMREFPGIVVFTQYQLENLIRVIPRISINPEALRHNFEMTRNMATGEAVYLALIMAGYQGDAHHLVNQTLVPRAHASGQSLISEFVSLASEDQELQTVVENIPLDIINMLQHPEQFTGRARQKALEIADAADKLIDQKRGG